MKDKDRTREQLIAEENMAGEASSPLLCHYDIRRAKKVKRILAVEDNKTKLGRITISN